MVKRTLALLLLLLSAAIGWGQNYSTYGSITAASTSCTAAACVYLQLPPNTNSVSVVLSGTWAATVQFETSADNGATWVSVSANPIPSGNAVTSATGNGTWTLAVPGMTYVRVRLSAYTSGTVSVVMQTSKAGQPTMPGVASDGASGIAVAGTVTAPNFTGTASNATQVGGAAVPASKSFVGTNSSGQIVDASGGGAVTGALTAPAFNVQSGAAGPNLALWDDFLFATTTSNLTTATIGAVSANSCGPGNTYTDVNHPGNIQLASGTGGTGTGQGCSLSNTASIFTPNSALGWTWESAVYVPVLPATTGGAYQAGLVTTIAVEPWTTGIGFWLSSANGVPNDWYCRYGSTAVDSTVAATVAWTRLTMTNDGVKVHWKINNVEVCGSGVALASLPSTTMLPGAWTSVAKSGTSMVMAVDYVTFQRAVAR